MSQPTLPAEVHAVLERDAQLLYDSGRVSLWIRVPSLLLGMLLWILFADLVSERILHIPFRFLANGPTTTPTDLLPALFGMGLLALFFCHLWIGQKRILVLPHDQQLIVEDRWFFGWYRLRIAIADIQRIEVKVGWVRGRVWNVQAIRADGRSVWLIRADDATSAKIIAERLAEAIDCQAAVT